MQNTLPESDTSGSGMQDMYEACALADVRTQLQAMAESEYAAFQSALLRKPGEKELTGSAAHYLGVRLPALRRMARQLAKQDWQRNLDVIRYANRNMPISDSAYEERMLEGMLIGLGAQGERDAARLFTEKFALVAEFLPLIDNWAICDSFCTGLKFVRKCLPACWEFLQPYLRSGQEYEIRFGVVMLLTYFIKEEYIDRIYPVLNGICHEGYYVKMAVSWAVSICFVRFPDKTMDYLKNCALDDFTYHKSLQKITESLCVSDEQKMKIRSMRRHQRF